MPSKYQPIIDVKQANPDLTWSDAAREAGFEGRWTSDGKGGVKPRSGDRAGQAAKRSSFDQPSTEMAGYESKRIKTESSRVSTEAQMYGLEETQIEHLADQTDSKAMTAGAPGDPTNLTRVRQSEARFKDKVKLAVGRDYAVTLNPATESIRVIPQKFYDPIADPSTLPGVDVKVGADITGLTDQVKRVRSPMSAVVSGSASDILRTVGKRAFSFVPFAGALLDAENAAAKVSRAAQTNDPVDKLQAGLATTAAADQFTPAGLTAGITDAFIDIGRAMPTASPEQRQAAIEQLGQQSGKSFLSGAMK